MSGIDEIMDMLDWKRSEETQNRGLELAEKVDEIGFFVMPHGPGRGMGIWENCARVLTVKSDNLLDPYAPQLLTWLADIMLPGAEIIFERLKRFSKTDGVLLASFEACAERAMNDDNTLWMGVLFALIDGNRQMGADLRETLPKHALVRMQTQYEEYFTWLNEGE